MYRQRKYYQQPSRKKDLHLNKKGKGALALNF